MMRYVLDASVALKCLLVEDDSASANGLREGFTRQFLELIAPDTLPVEMAHALTRAERRGVLRQGEAAVLLADFFDRPPVLHAYAGLLTRAVNLSSKSRIGVYDCLYIALAEREQCQVVTADLRLVNAFPSQAISLTSI